MSNTATIDTLPVDTVSDENEVTRMALEIQQDFIHITDAFTTITYAYEYITQPSKRTDILGLCDSKQNFLSYVNTTFGTEGITDSAALGIFKTVLGKIVEVVKKVVVKTVSFVKLLVSHDRKIRRNAAYYYKILSKGIGQIDSVKFYQFKAPATYPSSVTLMKLLSNVDHASFAISQVMDLFKAKNMILTADLQALQVIPVLQKLGITFSTDPDGSAVITPITVQNVTVENQKTATLKELGWTPTAVVDLLKLSLSKYNSISQLADKEQSLKKSLLDNIEDRVSKLETNVNYTKGSKFIATLIMQYGRSITNATVILNKIAAIAQQCL